MTPRTVLALALLCSASVACGDSSSGAGGGGSVGAVTKGSCFVGASLRNPQNLQPKLGQNQTVAGTFLTGPGVPGKVHACIDGLTSTLGGPVTLRFFQGVMGGSAGPDVPLTAVDLQSFNAFDVQLKEYDGACYSMSVIGSDGTVLASGFNHCDAQGVSDQ